MLAAATGFLVECALTLLGVATFALHYVVMWSIGPSPTNELALWLTSDERRLQKLEAQIASLKQRASVQNEKLQQAETRAERGARVERVLERELAEARATIAEQAAFIERRADEAEPQEEQQEDEGGTPRMRVTPHS